MKTNGTRTLLVIASLILVSLLITISGIAQPDYSFTRARLISGTDRQEGAVYLFRNVRSGTDAYVTITDIKNVTLSQLDGASGYDEAFQPYIFCPRKKKGYVEFRFDFVYAGTTNPRVMTEVPVTAIDIDGYINPDEKVYEFDEFDITPGYFIDYNMIGSSLSISVTGQNVQALNKTAVDYSGIDTVKKDVMFTMVYASVSSITIRAGVDNKSNSDIERLRSDYFKRFSYPSSFLSKPCLVSFRGNEKNSKVNLQWELSAGCNLSAVEIERATAPGQFKSIGEVWTGNDGDKQQFSFTDNMAVNGKAYYRLKMIAPNGMVQYSNILAFHSGAVNAEPFKVYPSVVQSSATINVKAGKSGAAIFQLVDYSGRVIVQQSINVQEGDNNIVINNLGNVNSGNYLALVKTSDNKIYNQKIFKQ